MKRFVNYSYLLCILIFVACTSDVEEANINDNVIQYSATLRLDCSIDDYGTNTRAVNSTDTTFWINGESIYVQFMVGDNRVAGKATYQGDSDSWVVTYNGSLPQGEVASCQLYYFKYPKSTTSTVVRLTPQSATYVDNQAQYIFDHGLIMIKGRLKPLVGRVRFKGPDRRVIRLSGLTYYDSYNVESGTLSQSNSIPSLMADGYTPYVYASFSNASERIMKINYGGLSFSKQFGSGVLAAGKSGFIDIPLIDSYEGWIAREEDFGGLNFSTLEYNTGNSLDYTYTDSYQPKVESWHWVYSLSSLHNDMFNMLYISYNDLVDNYDAIHRYYCGGKYTNEERIDGVLKQYIVGRTANGFVFSECSNDEYLGVIRINDGCLKWDVEGEKLKQFALDGYRTATRAIKFATYSSGLMDIYVILNTGTINVRKEDNTDPLGLCPDSNHPHAIDLGIGIKFACCNVGADSPTGYGNYYAWGETSTNSQYDWSTYKWCNGTQNSMTKYCTESSYGTVDNKTTLDLSDDAARANWGGSWRMPTYSELNKLQTDCTWTWTTVNNINGYSVTGSNGNSIFLPAAGHRYDTSFGGVSSGGYYWSSSLKTGDSFGAYGLYFSSNIPIYRTSRYLGESVRPVYDASNSNRITITVNGVSFTMIKVEGGTFQMGSTSGYDDQKPVHQVTLTNDYYIGETEVTQELWTAVMGSNPSRFQGSNQLPVERVSWNDCQTFITMLNALTGRTFRLPTEAEWEFAARGGNASEGYTYSGSNNVGDVAWYNSNSSSKTHDVATKAPNELGIYDMSGNVWEWCQDWYGSYSSEAQTNPTGPTSGSGRVNRCGCWSNYGSDCRVARRGWSDASSTSIGLGLRLAL